jgi:O-antigen/teichoic acid export membrane protein
VEDSFSKRYKLKLLSNIVNSIFNFIVIAIVPKELGPVGYGQFVYLQQVFNQFTSLLDSGTSTAFFTKLSANQNRKELISFYFLYSMILLFILYMFVIMISFTHTSNLFFPEIDMVYIYTGCFYGFMLWFIVFFTNISDAYALTMQSEFIKITHKIISVFILFLLISYYDLSTYAYLIYNNISLIVFTLLITLVLYRKDIFIGTLLKLKMNLKSLIIEFFTYSSPLLLFNIFSIIFSLFDIWLLQAVSGSKETGFYGIAYSIAAMCFIFTSSMTPVLTREFSKLYAEKNFKEIKRMFEKYIPMMYSIAAYFSVFVAFNSENLLSIFTNDNFKDAFLVVCCMAFYPIHQTYGQLSGSVFYVSGQTKLVKNIGITSIIIGFILSIVLIYFMNLGAFGLALKMVIAQIIAVNIQLYFNSRFLKLDFMYFIINQIVIVFILMIIMQLVNFIVPDLSNNLFDFLLKGFLYTIIVTIFFLKFSHIIGLTKSEIMLGLNSLKNRISGN